jgi:MATE family multidrug resistance protein
VVRVGNLVGAGRPREAQRAAWVALALGAAVMGASALVIILGRESIPALYGVEPAVQALAVATMPIAAAFQIFDGLQVVGCGVLRGMGQTKPAAWMNLVGYYVLALPIAYWLAFDRGQGVAGLWWGLTVGLMAVSAALVAWIAVRGPASVVYRRV